MNQDPDALHDETQFVQKDTAMGPVDSFRQAAVGNRSPETSQSHFDAASGSHDDAASAAKCTLAGRSESGIPCD